jgi:uncharacterized membrane protein YbhN (UPF0104 family)
VTKAVKFSIGLVFSVVGMVYAFRQFNWIEFIDSLRGINYWYLLGAVALQLGAIWLRALRWKWLLSPIKNVPLRTTFDATIIGYFGNSVLPVRMGELLRAYIVANNSTLSVAQVVGSLIVERMLDVLGVVIFALIFLFNFEIINIPNWLILSIVLTTIVLFGILFLISSNKINWHFVKKRKYLFQSKIGSKIYGILKNIMWGMYYLSFIFVVKSANLGLNWVDSGVLFILLSLAISIPAAPGYIGTYHATCVGALTTIYNIGLGESQAFAVLAHAINFVPIVIVGAIFFLKNSMKFSKLKSLNVVES